MSKSEADCCKKIEVWWLLRDIKERGYYKNTTISWGENGSHGSIGAFVDLYSDDKHVRFTYTQTDSFTGDKKDFDYKVPLVETSCHFGGSRYWFECSLFKNNQYCGRRVGVLYKDGNWFGCRHCYELTYSSRKVNRNYQYYPMFRYLELDQEIHKLEASIKRYTYKGKLTKKAQKLEKLYQEASLNARRFRRAEKGLDFTDLRSI